MILKAYRKNIEILSSFYENPFPAELANQLQLQYALVSASLSNFLPALPVEKHSFVYRQILLHQKLSLLDESNYAGMDQLEVQYQEDYHISQFRSQPAIFCTAHNGSYRLINFYLKKLQIPYALVANKNIILTEKERFQENYDHFYVKDCFPLEIIDAEEPTSLMRMLRAIKNGKSLLIYVDGNTGSGNQQENQHSVPVAFLAQQLLVRSGPSYLSIKTNTPIIPVISFKPSLYKNILLFFPIIYPSTQSVVDRVQICNITQRIYDHLASIILINPTQWEAWLYLHKVAKVDTSKNILLSENLSGTNDVIFNSREFGIFKTGTRCFLLQKNTYSSFPIDDSLYDFLSFRLPSELKDISIAEGLLDQLCSERIVLKPK
ncbi:MAG: hypothetical protein QM802_02455 [Agriterribacter sp.]